MWNPYRGMTRSLPGPAMVRLEMCAVLPSILRNGTRNTSFLPAGRFKGCSSATNHSQQFSVQQSGLMKDQTRHGHSPSGKHCRNHDWYDWYDCVPTDIARSQSSSQPDFECESPCLSKRQHLCSLPGRRFKNQWMLIFPKLWFTAWQDSTGSA